MEESVLADVRDFRVRVEDVSVKRDLWTATERGAELNRILSSIDRSADKLNARQLLLLDLARQHVKEMMNCPRRMRLDNTWQDDFVREARKAADALQTLIEMEPEGA